MFTTFFPKDLDSHHEAFLQKLQLDSSTISGSFFKKMLSTANSPVVRAVRKTN